MDGCKKYCLLCGEEHHVSIHHVLGQKDNKALKKCAANKISLCSGCHSFVHSKKGAELNNLLKLCFQNYIEFIFAKNEFTFKEIQELLEITKSCTNQLIRDIPKNKNGNYDRDKIINSIMVKTFNEEEANQLLNGGICND